MASPSHRRSLRKRRTALLSAAAVAAAGLGAVPFVMNANAGAVDLAHQALPAKDGWAASGSGTTGGSKADSAHTFTVSTRAQLVKALGSATDSTPKIIKIKGTIDANTDDAGKKLTCADYASGTGYSLSAYLKAYDPADVRQEGALGHAGEGPRGRPDQADEEHRLQGARPTPPSWASRAPRPASPAAVCRCRTSTTSSSATCPSPPPRTASRSGTRPTAPPASGTPTTTR